MPRSARESRSCGPLVDPSKLGQEPASKVLLGGPRDGALPLAILAFSLFSIPADSAYLPPRAYLEALVAPAALLPPPQRLLGSVSQIFHLLSFCPGFLSPFTQRTLSAAITSHTKVVCHISLHVDFSTFDLPGWNHSGVCV